MKPHSPLDLLCLPVWADFSRRRRRQNPLTTGQQGMAQMTANARLFMNPRNAAGTEIATAANPYRIDPTGVTTQPVSGTVTSNAGTNLNTSAWRLRVGGTCKPLRARLRVLSSKAT